MKKDFITATPDSGGSGSTTVTVAASWRSLLNFRHINQHYWVWFRKKNCQGNCSGRWFLEYRLRKQRFQP